MFSFVKIVFYNFRAERRNDRFQMYIFSSLHVFLSSSIRWMLDWLIDWYRISFLHGRNSIQQRTDPLNLLRQRRSSTLQPVPATFFSRRRKDNREQKKKSPSQFRDIGIAFRDFVNMSLTSYSLRMGHFGATFLVFEALERNAEVRKAFLETFAKHSHFALLVIDSTPTMRSSFLVGDRRQAS